MIAGIPKKLQKSWNISNNDIFIIEADEYDTSYFDKRPKFIHYHPSILLINNIEFDHADIYENIEMIEHNKESILNNEKIKDLLSKNNFKLIKNFDFNFIYKKEN